MIRVLCSGTALGHYVPGLLVRNALQRLGHAVETEVYEGLLATDKRRLLERTADRYRRDFDLALLGQRLAKGGLIEAVSQDRAQAACLEDWRRAEVGTLVLLSGQWVPLAAAHAERKPGTAVHLLHVDSTDSPSWSSMVSVPASFEHVWLHSSHEGRLKARIPVDGLNESGWAERPRRVVCHGGGWGLGTYREYVETLLERGYEVEIVAHTAEEAARLPGTCRCLLPDPGWRPWARVGGVHVFPPLRTADGAAVVPDGAFHALLDRIRRARAVVSKPGGATLVDSLIAATPVVFLEPYGEHEAANARLWRRLGLGIGFETWREQGFGKAPLAACHRRLREAAERIAHYPDDRFGTTARRGTQG